MTGLAAISDCGLYRYSLSRSWDDMLPTVCFIMCNPSTADASKDDPTIRRCIKFAQRWGYGTLHVTNLFAYRATDPRELRKAIDPVGPMNDHWIETLAKESDLVVAAWGANGGFADQAWQMCEMLRGWGVVLHYIRMGAKQPEHPLYLPGSLNPVRWDY